MTFIVKEQDRFFVVPDLKNSQHAQIREGQRGISKKQVMLAYQYGRVIHSRRATYYVIGNKEIEKYGSIEPELKAMNGIQLVMSSNGTVMTAFRNKDLRKIRPFKHSHKHLH
ncbi:hypothetical protein CWC26_00995 [Pseudoalteromonas sp. S4488]|jgi:hypothetical protein|uniref:DUF4258 domain-containing protein n=1 Tax=unclassified Pseudoalteromonas TaxID=194690 RepID=UPI0010232270|nr:MULTISPECIES: DUF4258 domain-containing protein [unclassified Pseudoalteromonas]RZF78269.1 DUF4258 domain-containing protein [Pseudoalteromonas sp. CO109Y]TMO28670.1 hypothetical protein CWC28_08580 [Pseudoalteromonas sp. S4492]TMO35467.1 hypothetical protein CWC27_10350 [Pseudoalteromonas sp. S4491]TMO41628.1 hypothetical protein CWC26_00995 [Pseudoalteromonas sp. S4488]